MTILFTVKFDVHMACFDETFACTSEPMTQHYLPEFIQKITEAGHTLVEVCRVEEDHEPEDYEDEEIVVEEDWDDDDPDLEICEDN